VSDSGRVLPTPGGARRKEKNINFQKLPPDPSNPSQNAIICLKYADMYIVHKTLLKSLQKHCQTVFSRFLSMTIFILAENTRHSE
jgi:hypothetical protein